MRQCQIPTELKCFESQVIPVAMTHSTTTSKTKVTMPTDFGLFLRVVTSYRIGNVQFEFDLSVSHTFINVAESPPLKTVQSVSGRSSSEI